jgi:hypothetical protein
MDICFSLGLGGMENGQLSCHVLSARCSKPQLTGKIVKDLLAVNACESVDKLERKTHVN